MFRSVLWAVVVFSLAVACAGEEITRKDDRKDEHAQFRVMQREMENLKSEVQLMRAQLKSCSSDREIIREIENDHVILHWVQTTLHDLRSEVTEMERAIVNIEERTKSVQELSKTEVEQQRINRVFEVILECVAFLAIDLSDY